MPEGSGGPGLGGIGAPIEPGGGAGGIGCEPGGVGGRAGIPPRGGTGAVPLAFAVLLESIRYHNRPET